MTERLHLEAEYLELRTRHPFIIARGGQSDYRTSGCACATATATWAGARRRRRGSTARPRSRCWPRSTCTPAACPADPFDLEETERRWESMLRDPRIRARGALGALHDLVGKRLGIPLYRLWGLDPAKAPRSTFTIGLDTPERIRPRCRRRPSIPILKMKLGTDRDVEILRAIRECHRQGDPGGRQLRLDREAGDRHAPGAAGVRRDRARAAAAARPDRRARGHHAGARRSPSSPTRAAGRPRTSRRWWARWTASTSSSPSAAACARRSA